MLHKTLTTTAFALAAMTAPVLAQVDADAVVAVHIGDARAELAAEFGVDEAEIADVIFVPVEVAAVVCEIDVVRLRELVLVGDAECRLVVTPELIAYLRAVAEAEDDDDDVPASLLGDPDADDRRSASPA
jgi:hypothetical protein